MPSYIIYSVSVVKIINGGKDIVCNGLIWVGFEFFVCCGVGKVFLNFADVEGGVHKA